MPGAAARYPGAVVITRLGLCLALIGAAAILADALPLPLHSGWILIAAAAAIAGSAVWVSLGHSGAAVLPIALCVLTSAPIVAGATWSNNRQLGTGDPLFIAAAGTVVAFVGSLLLSRRTAKDRDHESDVDYAARLIPASESGACPRCARQLKAGARTCHHCGFAVRRYRRDTEPTP